MIKTKFISSFFKSKIDDKCKNIFIISISDFVQEIRCVLCFKSRYPLPEQVPVIQNLKFKLNLCKVKGKDVDELEEKNILSNIKCSMLNSLADHDIDTSSQIKEVLKQQVDSLFRIFQVKNLVFLSFTFLSYFLFLSNVFKFFLNTIYEQHKTNKNSVITKGCW